MANKTVLVLQVLRVAWGLTLVKLALRVGSIATTLSMIEAGARTPSDALLNKIADVFEVPPNLLLLPINVVDIVDERPRSARVRKGQ
jgi:transcriptional regulator with XRE-family HTH domain